MGIELELYYLLAILILGSVLFGRFEEQTPPWRRILKWTIIILGTVGLYEIVGHGALLFPTAALIIGGTVHTVWCRKHDIHPLQATPHRKYYELRGWEWTD